MKLEITRNTNQQKIKITKIIWFLALSVSGVSAQAGATPTTNTPTATTPTFGTYSKPFAATSPWNSRPVSPTFGKYEIPKDAYFPSITAGAYATGVFKAPASSNPVNVGGLAYDSKTKTYSCIFNDTKLYDADSESLKNSVMISRWPNNTVPATGGDGHADIIDETDNVIHSFWQLRNINGQWCATQYAWTSLKGRGFGNPAHYFQGARAAAVPTSGGLIRTHEVNDGKAMYEHALAMSLTFSGLSASPTYIYPATSADTNAATTNKGGIPEGALMMLPPTFDISKLKGNNPAATAEIQKVARTLQTYGAYVVDRNFGTPYVIYAEIGSGYNLHKKGWDNNIANSLQAIRAGLRQVTSVKGMIDGNGKTYVDNPKTLNMISMRGQWAPVGSFKVKPVGTYSTAYQAAYFSNMTGPTTFANYSTRGFAGVSWGMPVAGASYRFIPTLSSPTATFQIKLLDVKGKTLFDSGKLKNKQALDMTWPAGKVNPALFVITGDATNQSASAIFYRLK